MPVYARHRKTFWGLKVELHLPMSTLLRPIQVKRLIYRCQPKPAMAQRLENLNGSKHGWIENTAGHGHDGQEKDMAIGNVFVDNFG